MTDDFTVQIDRTAHHRPVPGWSWNPARIPAFDLWFVHRGRGVAVTPHGTFNIQRGLCLLLRRGEAYRFRQALQAPVDVTYCHFKIVHKSGGPVPVNDADLPFFTELRDISFFEQMVQRMTEAWQGNRPNEAQDWLKSMIREITSPIEGGHKGRWGADLERLRTEIARDPGRWTMVEELAAEIGLSRVHFTRLFRATCNVSPGRFLIDCRMGKARELLRDSNTPINQIAATLGYNHTAFFCRQFRQHTGCTPSAYRHGS